MRVWVEEKFLNRRRVEGLDQVYHKEVTWETTGATEPV